MAPMGGSGGRKERSVGVAVVGAGYWGPNLIRNFLAADEVDVRWVCDLDEARARQVLGTRTTVRTTTSLDDVLADPCVTAVAVATPAGTHRGIAGACLDAGRHVLVEKPLACSTGEAEGLVRRAETAGVVLMCDHTYCYSPPARYLHDLLHSGEAGDLQYLDSVRINLGLVQPDVDVFWDLGPHDLSILDYVLPATCQPVSVAAQGADPLGVGRSCVGYLTLQLANGAIAHLHLNWLSPTKVRTLVVGGSRRMAVWDDLAPAQRINVYDKGASLEDDRAVDEESRRTALVSYRSGDMWAPALPLGEPLAAVVAEFVASILERRKPLTDGDSGLRVLRILEAIPGSLELGGAAVLLDHRAGTDGSTALAGAGSEQRR
jgi:predicted dehydrogenase